MKYSVILFDLDQTLIQKEPSTVEVVLATVNNSWHPVAKDQVERAYSASEIWIANQVMLENQTGKRMDDDNFLNHIFAEYQNELHLPLELKEILLPIFRGECEQTYQLMPGALDVIRTLHLRGAHLGVVSNHHATIRNTLDHLGLSSYFEAIIISDEVKLWKPDPAIIRMALERMGADTQEALYIGDHPFDILCAHEAGIHAAWMPSNPHFILPEFVGMPEYKMTNLMQLLAI